jgi:hypothetical protein
MLPTGISPRGTLIDPSARIGSGSLRWPLSYWLTAERSAVVAAPPSDRVVSRTCSTTGPFGAGTADDRARIAT